ncbi:MAG: MATE family efflux transporter [Christensenellaceae bacterium]|jgi:putative MATE family efflux protein|nr:MATE family efflux transporter [Christensenellaceae bacterium]
MALMTKDREFYKSFFTMVFFIALQNLVVQSVNLASNIMVGAYSEHALSGVAIVNQIQFLLQMLINGAGEGVVVLGAQYWGQKNTASIKKIIGSGVYLALGLGLLFLLATSVAPRQLLLLLTNDEAVIAEGLQYLSVTRFSYVFFCLSMVFLSSMRSVENVRIGTVISLSTLFVNVGLSYILIFGSFGAPRLGSAGAGFAVLAARVIEFFILLGYMLFIEKKIAMRIADFFHFELAIFWDYIKVGLPVIGAGAVWGLAMGVQTAILGRLGGSAIAANSIQATIFSMLTVLSYGGASAASVMTGKIIGRGEGNNLREYVRSMQLLFLALGCLACVLLLSCKDLILGFYQVTPETYALSGQFLNVVAFTSIGTSYQVACLTGIVRGGGDTKFVLINDTIFMWLVVLPASALCAFVWNLPPVIVFLALKSDQVLKCFVAIWHVNFHGYRWVRKLTKAPAAEAEGGD